LQGSIYHSRYYMKNLDVRREFTTMHWQNRAINVNQSAICSKRNHPSKKHVTGFGWQQPTE
jgi:hypothetical protein